MSSWSTKAAHTLYQKISSIVAVMLLASAPFFVVMAPGVAYAASSGEVTISEFMADPTIVTDANGEWIELHNNTGAAIDLSGWSIDDGGNPHTFGSLVIAPGTGVVLCRNSSAASNGGVVCGDGWTGMSLANSGDTITLHDDLANVIDAITYTGSAVTAGHSSTITSGTIGSETTAKYNNNNFGTPYGTPLLDTTPPIFTDTRPDGSRHTHDSLETRAYVADPESTITGVTIAVSGPVSIGPLAMVFDTMQNRWEYSINTNALGMSDGVYNYSFTATNSAGLSTTKTIAGINVDNTLPTAQITTPNATTLSGTVNISGTVSDTYIKRWHVVIRDLASKAIVVNFASYDLSDINYVWDTTSLGYNGVFSITLHGYDEAGNRTLGLSEINYLVVTVDNKTSSVVAPTPVSPKIVPGSSESGDVQPIITLAATPAGIAGGGIGFIGGANLGVGNVLGANTDNANAQTQTNGNTSSTSTTGGTIGRVKATSDTKRSWLSYWYYWLPTLLVLLGLILLLAKRRRNKDDQNTTV